MSTKAITKKILQFRPHDSVTEDIMKNYNYRPVFEVFPYSKVDL